MPTGSTPDLEGARRRVQAAVVAIETMSAKERKTPASDHFGRIFNSILELAKHALPDVDPAKWPGPVASRRLGSGGFCEARHAELSAHLRRVAALFPRRPGRT